MGLLKLLGIGKYLKKVKTYVDDKASELDTRINNIKPSAPTPDWNAGQGQDGHILNRTHYAVGQFFELDAYANGDEEIVYDLDGNYRVLMLVKLEKDGSSVEFTVTLGEEKTVAIGAKEVRFYYGSSTEVYVYGENLGDIRCFIHDTVVSEESYRQSFRQLDEKYIPDTIARKSDIPSAPAESKTAWQNYQEWSELTDGFWQNEEAYNKYLSVRDGMCGIDTRRPEYKYEHFEKWVSWDTYGFTWYQFVTIKDRNPEYATVEDYNSGEGMTVSVKDLEGESFMLRINPNNETIYLIGY